MFLARLKNMKIWLKPSEFKQKIRNIIKRFVFFPNRQINGLKILCGSNGFLLNFTNGAFVTHKLYPSNQSEILLSRRVESNFPRTAIIVQGPIGINGKFFLDTLKLYVRIFPKNSVLIVPVLWSDESPLLITQVQAIGVHPVVIDKPEFGGLFNVDFQTTAVSAGIEYALGKGCSYVIRSRTDCRIHDPDAITKLHAISSIFPARGLKKTRLNERLPGRIVASSIVTCMYRVYGLTDILLFGSSTEMLEYFKPESHSRWIEENGLSAKHPLAEGTPVVSEIFLCARYLQGLGLSLDWSLAHWHQCLANYFAVVDAEMIDLFWKKYEWQYADRFNRGYSNSTGRLVKFCDWLLLYAGNNVVDLGVKEEWEITIGRLSQKRVL